MTDNTVLVISAMGVTPYSARGLSEKLEHIQAAQSMRRTINGTLRDVSETQFRKYKLSITCSDQDAPALEGYWPGMEVTVDCVSELAYPTGSGSPSRTVVPLSSRDADGFTFYRPRLTMLITSFNTTKDEWGAVVAWQLDLEEV